MLRSCCFNYNISRIMSNRFNVIIRHYSFFMWFFNVNVNNVICLMFEISLSSIKRNLQDRDKAIFDNLFALTKNTFTKLNVDALMFEK